MALARIVSLIAGLKEWRCNVARSGNVSDGPYGKLTRCNVRPTILSVTVTITLRGPCQAVSSIICAAEDGPGRIQLTAKVKKLP